MPYSRFKDFRRFLPEIFADFSKDQSDPWFRFSTAVDDLFDKQYFKALTGSQLMNQ
jgi:hypothetical protein